MPTNTYSMTSSVFDAEERTDTGAIDRTSSDLEFGRDAVPQYVGMYWEFIDVPQGATITEAYVTLTAKEVQTGAMTVRLHAHNTDSSSYFLGATNDISDRPRTTAYVDWEPEDWDTIDVEHQTPDLSAIIQELVDREGWESGNHIAIISLPQAGNRRTAHSYNGDPTKAATLTISYSLAPPGPAQASVPRARERVKVVTSGPSDPIQIAVDGLGDPVIVVDVGPAAPIRTAEELAVGGTYRIKRGIAR